MSTTAVRGLPWRPRGAALLLGLLLASPTFAQAPAPPPNPDDPADTVVKRVHEATLTLDPHIDVRDDFDTPGNEADHDTSDAFDLPKLERGGLDVATVALFADPLRLTPENVVAARTQVDRKLAALKRFVAEHPTRLELARTADDLERIPATGKHAILLSFLNGLALGKDLSLLAAYQKEGVRLFGFTHAGNNDFADSSRPSAGFGDVPNAAGGLTPLGKQAVAELNRLGVIIDVSQLTPEGVSQVVQLSRAPVVASHSAVRGRVNVARNLSNAELRAIAATGGVVHIVAFVPYLRPSAELASLYEKNVFAPFGLKPGDNAREKLEPAAYAKFQAAYREYSRNEWRHATVGDWLDAVDYAVRLIGIDHVGLSSDFNHGGGVTGYANVGEAPNVTRELLKRGYSEADIAKLWGGNFLRVFRAVEGSAARASGTSSVGSAPGPLDGRAAQSR